MAVPCETLTVPRAIALDFCDLVRLMGRDTLAEPQRSWQNCQLIAFLVSSCATWRTGTPDGVGVNLDPIQLDRKF